MGSRIWRCFYLVDKKEAEEYKRMKALFSTGNCYKQLLYDHFTLDCKGDEQLQPNKSVLILFNEEIYLP